MYVFYFVIQILKNLFCFDQMSPEEYDHWNYELRPKKVEILLNGKQIPIQLLSQPNCTEYSSS